MPRLLKRKSSRTASDEAVQQGLRQIYGQEDMTPSHAGTLEVQPRSRWKNTALSVLGLSVVAVVAWWLGYSLFSGTGIFNNSSVEITIDAPSTIASGDELTYVVHYKNIDSVALKNIELLLRYPDGFEFTSAEPAATNAFNTSWTLSDLPAGGTGSVTIRGVLVGEVGSIQNLNATLSFQPANFNSPFKETVSKSTQITSSILAIMIQGPTQILPEKKAVYTITYQNNSDQELKNVKIITEYPSNFVFQEANPQPTQGVDPSRKVTNEWLVASLQPRQQGTIEITGGYVVDPNTTTVALNASIGFYTASDGTFAKQQEQTFTTEVTRPAMTLDLIVNGSGEDQPIALGDQLTYSISYKNRGQQDLDDVTISLTIDSDLVDWKSLDDINKGKVNGNTITWTKEQIPALDVVRPQMEGTINVQLTVKSEIPANAKPMVLSKAVGTVAKFGDLIGNDVKIESKEIENAVNSDVSLTVEGRYFDDDNIPVGTGPLPPVVGEETTFRIYWSLDTSVHDITNVTVKATLPRGADWANKTLTSVGKVTYDSATRQVVWTIDRISANKTKADVNAWFDVAVTPTNADVRKLLILTNQTSLKATDAESDADIVKNGKAVTSNLEDDPIGGGKGLVVDITD